MLQATSATQHKDDDQTKKGADEPGEGGDDDPAETRDLSGNLKHLLWSLSHVYLSNAMHFRLRKPSWIDFEPKINLETDFNNPLEYWGNLLLYIYYSLNWLLLISDKEIYFVVFSSLQRQATCILFGICKFFFIFSRGFGVGVVVNILGERCSRSHCSPVSIRTRAVESESLKVWKSLKVGKSQIKAEKSDLIFH